MKVNNKHKVILNGIRTVSKSDEISSSTSKKGLCFKKPKTEYKLNDVPLPLENDNN